MRHRMCLASFSQMMRRGEGMSKEYVEIGSRRIAVGDRIEIRWADDSNGKDWQAREMVGRIGTVEKIDDNGSLWGTWGGLAVIPTLDDYVVFSRNNQLIFEVVNHG